VASIHELARRWSSQSLAVSHAFLASHLSVRRIVASSMKAIKAIKAIKVSLLCTICS